MNGPRSTLTAQETRESNCLLIQRDETGFQRSQLIGLNPMRNGRDDCCAQVVQLGLQVVLLLTIVGDEVGEFE